MKKIAIICCSLMLCIICLCLCCCVKQVYMASKTYYDVFGTVLQITILLNDDKSIKKAEKDIDIIVANMRRLESIISANELRYPNSDIAKFNKLKKDESVNISDETAELFKLSKTLYEITEGAFDPSVYYLVDFWGFSDFGNGLNIKNEKPVLNSHLLEKLKKTVGFSMVNISGEKGSYKLTKSALPVYYNEVLLQLRLDFGAIGKGFAVDLMKDAIVKCGYNSGFISLGGSSIYALENLQSKDGFEIELVNPRSNSEQYYGKTYAFNEAVSSSGDYQRYFIENGRRYSHLIDSVSGFPINNNVAMVTVISQSAAVGDALTTAFSVMGKQKVKIFAQSEYFKKNDLKYALVVDNGETLIVSGNLSPTITDKKYIIEN
ncbi:MAG: FAD:protein FMN transferase [Clostridia bacterium]